MWCSALSLLVIVRYSPPTSGPTLGEVSCRVVKDPPNAVLPDLFWYGYRPAKPLPSGVRQCKTLTDHVDWRFLAVFPAPGAVRGAYQFHCVISSTVFLSYHLPRESSSPPHRSPVSLYRALDLLQPLVASHSASHRLLM